jgi:hypothetical protein
MSLDLIPKRDLGQNSPTLSLIYVDRKLGERNDTDIIEKLVHPKEPMVLGS